MRVAGIIRPPGDKSITHRMLMLAGLARGRSRIAGALTATDVKSTARALRLLGPRVGVLRRGATVVVDGTCWRAPTRTVHCGNSGTAARLLMGILAAHPFAVRLTGDGSLRRRPMGRVTEPLRRMGATFTTAPDDRLPLTVRGGSLHGIDYDAPIASAQVKSAILLAGLVGDVTVTVTEPWRSRDHTERLLIYLGCDLRQEGTRVTLAGGAAAKLVPFDMTVPGDPSSAAFLVAAAILAEDGELVLERVGVNPTRAGFLRVLDRMGARVERADERWVGNEPVADLLIRPASLRATEVSAAEIPGLVDEIPILAVLASRASGESIFRRVGELRVKESNRLELLAANLRAVGCRAEVQGDDLYVAGSDAPPQGRVETAGDHRIAMAFAVLGTLERASVTLSERASPAISYPGFFDDLARIDTDAR